MVVRLRTTASFAFVLVTRTIGDKGEKKKKENEKATTFSFSVFPIIPSDRKKMFSSSERQVPDESSRQLLKNSIL